MIIFPNGTLIITSKQSCFITIITLHHSKHQPTFTTVFTFLNLNGWVRRFSLSFYLVYTIEWHLSIGWKQRPFNYIIVLVSRSFFDRWSSPWNTVDGLEKWIVISFTRSYIEGLAWTTFFYWLLSVCWMEMSVELWFEV